MIQIGNVAQPAGTDSHCLTAIYGARIIQLPHSKEQAWFQQVLIRFLGSYVWINTQPESIYPFPHVTVSDATIAL